MILFFTMKTLPKKAIDDGGEISPSFFLPNSRFFLNIFNKFV